uniref:Uncharacterized protein n=1 Tax=Anguilla anguilla TaxID=7936 RepID=A0A0E9VT04_ANGAN
MSCLLKLACMCTTVP